MATRDVLERSIEGSKPLEVYSFSLGTDEFRFTSADDDVTLSGDIFPVESISRNNVATGQDERGKILEVTVPITNIFAAQYLLIPPGQRATCTVRRLQRDETPTFDTQELVFKGFVQSVRFPDDAIAVIAVQTLEASVSRTIPRFTFQGLCNHILYDDQCLVDPNLHNIVSALVTAEVDNTITVTGAAASGNKFAGGYVRPTGVTDFRLVLEQSGDVLTLQLPFAKSVLSQTVDAFAGCNHVVDGDCLLVFDNVPEFGGYAFVPKKNPFTTTIQVTGTVT